MNISVVNDFLSSFDDNRFPESFLKSYEAIECLSSNQSGETLLIKQRETGEIFISKCYSDKSFHSNVNESELLKGLSHPGLPNFVEENRNNEMTCVVREYVNGTPLDRLVYEKQFTENQIIDICIQLCDIMIYLHSKTPPIIHRDIKPQNIIVESNGRIKLIDFGISRMYNEMSQSDTVFFGTEKFAPPEQYGFSQTDCRSDIFSFGVLLSWLLTGNTDIKKAVSIIKNKRLAHIVRKCTAFAPEKRYASAEKLMTALLYSDGHVQRARLRSVSRLLLALVILCIGFSVGRYTDFAPTFFSSQGLKFKEPLIEKAIRLTLGKDTEMPISEEELLKITKLYICADRIAKDATEFEVICEEIMIQGDIFTGGIESLEDLTMLKNLREISLIRQSISDVSPLKQLEQIENIDLKHNPIKDVSALKSLPGLQSLYLFDTYVSDLSELSECSRLTNLDIGKTNINTLADLRGLDKLKSLGLQESVIKSLNGIEMFPFLSHIYLPKTYIEDLSQLQSLPYLEEVVLDEHLRIEAEKQLQKPNFTIIYK